MCNTHRDAGATAPAVVPAWREGAQSHLSGHYARSGSPNGSGTSPWRRDPPGREQVSQAVSQLYEHPENARQELTYKQEAAGIASSPGCRSPLSLQHSFACFFPIFSPSAFCLVGWPIRSPTTNAFFCCNQEGDLNTMSKASPGPGLPSLCRQKRLCAMPISVPGASLQA